MLSFYKNYGVNYFGNIHLPYKQKPQTDFRKGGEKVIQHRKITLDPVSISNGVIFPRVCVVALRTLSSQIMQPAQALAIFTDFTRKN